MSPEKEEQDYVRLPRVTMEFKIPLPALISGGIFVVWGLISMWFKINGMETNVEELKIAVKANNLTTVQYASEQVLIKYRLEKLEARQDKEK